jgi:hypothetical protein
MFTIGNAACSFDILSPKNVRNSDARDVALDSVGCEGCGDRESRVFSVFESFRG